MIKNDFDNLKAKREKWLISTNENGFNMKDILSEMYIDSAHFIFELIQNAEDIGAKEVYIRLNRDKLEFYHNSVNDFSFENVDAITGIGMSTKKDDVNTIGKFGVGFKSVFSITESPHIYSGDFAFRIHDYVVPVEVDKPEQFGKGTLFVLPFHKNGNDKSYGLVYHALKNLNPKTLLFLKNVEKIRWETESDHGEFTKKSSIYHSKTNCRLVHLMSNQNQVDYLVFERPLSFMPQLNVGVAYKSIMKKEKNYEYRSLIRDIDTKLIVFFPTEKETMLKFNIHGPFRTTPNRENIPFESKDNMKILEEIALLTAASILDLKDMGLLSVEFLDLLPIIPSFCDANTIYDVCYHAVNKILGTSAVLPKLSGGFGKADEQLLAKGTEISDLLDAEDLYFLYKKKSWLDTSITIDKARDLREYLIKVLKIKEVSFEEFVKNVDIRFWPRKSDEWMIQFYQAASTRPALLTRRDGLRQKSIIRTQNNEQIKPYIDDEPSAFLPSNGISTKNTLKREIAKDVRVKECMAKLGLKEVNAVNIIIDTIEKKYSSPNQDYNYSEYISDFDRIFQIYNSVDKVVQNKIASELQNKYIVLCIEPSSGSKELVLPEKAYFPSRDLMTMFEDQEGKYFISEDFYGRYPEERLTRVFLSELGVNEGLCRVKTVNPTLSPEYKAKLRADTEVSSEKIEDFEIDGLTAALEKMTPEKSIALWNLLSREQDSFFKGIYSWKFHAAYTQYFPAKFINELNENNWLLDREGNLRIPHEILDTELSDRYERNQAGILLSYINFRLGVLDKLPDKFKDLFKAASSLDETQLKSILGMINKLHNKPVIEKTRTDILAVAPNHFMKNYNTQMRQIEGVSFYRERPLIAQVVSPIAPEPNHGNLEDRVMDYAGEELDSGNIAHNREFGEWGETFVMNEIAEDYRSRGYQVIEIPCGYTFMKDDAVIHLYNMNSSGSPQMGYDIKKVQNNIVTEIIEVKTKAGNHTELFYVSGPQWELAKSLYHQGEGDKYCIYVVAHSGMTEGRSTIYRNPYLLWQEGKLYANPVKIEV